MRHRDDEELDENEDFEEEIPVEGYGEEHEEANAAPPEEPSEEGEEPEEALKESDKIELEKQLVAEGKILPRGHRPKARFRGLLAVCLSFLFGIIATLGGLVGGVVYLGTRAKVGTTLSAFGLDPEKYINEEYAEMSILELGSELKGTQFTNLDSIGKYTPFIENMISPMLVQFSELGINADVKEFMQTAFTEFGPYFQNLLMSAELGKALGLSGSSDALMLAICYGKQGVDFDVDGSGNIVMRDGKSPTLLKTLTDDATGIIGRIDIGTVLSVTDDSAPIMKAIKDWTIEDLSNATRINRLRIKQVVSVGEGASALLRAIADWRIGDLTKQSRLDSLCLGDVITIDESSPRILQSLKDSTIGGISDDIRTLQLVDFLGEEAVSGNRILKHLKNSTIDTLSDDLSALTIGEVFADQVFSYMEMEGDKGYRETVALYRAHVNEKEYNTDAYRPHAIDKTGKEIREYRVAGETRLEKGYYVQGESGNFTAAPEGTEVRYDAAIARANRTPAASGEDAEPALPVWQTPYYFEQRTRLIPVYTYGFVNYDTGYIELPTESRRIPDDAQIEEDDYGFYYRDETGKRIDLEQILTGYHAENGVEYKVQYPFHGDVGIDPSEAQITDLAGNEVKVHHARAETGEEGEIPAYDYVSARVELFERYADGEGNLYTAAETETRYEYDKETGTGTETVRLDRYLSGVWYLLLAQTDESGAVTFKTDTPVLEMDSLVSDVHHVMNDTPLWSLWLHEILKENPYVPLAIHITLSYDDGREDKTVTNLIEVTLGETVAVIKAFNNEVSALLKP